MISYCKLFENGTHELSTATHATAQARNQIYTDAAKWVGVAEAWLEKRFALELPDFIFFLLYFF
jgi:hypothetical protein